MKYKHSKDESHINKLHLKGNFVLLKIPKAT